MVEIIPVCDAKLARYQIAKAPIELPLTLVFAKPNLHLLFTPIDRSQWSAFGQVGIGTLRALGVVPFKGYHQDIPETDLEMAKEFGTVGRIAPKRWQVDLELPSFRVHYFLWNVWALPEVGTTPKIDLGDNGNAHRLLPMKLPNLGLPNNKISSILPYFHED